MKQLFAVKNRMLLVMGFLILGLLVANIIATVDTQAQLGKLRNVDALRIVAYDSSRTQGVALFNGVTTFASRVVGSSSQFCRIDSFTTTSLTKVVTMTGAAVGDVFQVTPFVPAYSAVVDTNSSPYYATVDSAGYVTVGRVGRLGQTVKSGALFYITKFEK